MGRGLPGGPQLTAQLTIMVTPQFAGECRAWSEAEHSYASAFLRRAVEAGLDALRPGLVAAHGELDAAVLREHADRAERKDTWAKARRDPRRAPLGADGKPMAPKSRAQYARRTGTKTAAKATPKGSTKASDRGVATTSRTVIAGA